MSSSKGAGSSSREVADLLPPHMMRLLLLQKEPQRVIDFVPDGDTIPLLYDSYDSYAAHYFGDEKDDYTRTFYLIHTPEERKAGLPERVLPRFSQVAYLIQMPHIDLEAEVKKMFARTELTKEDKAEITLRSTYASKWLATCAPEDYKFDIQKKLPEAARQFSSAQKEALRKVAAYLESVGTLDGQELHTALHEIRKATAIEPADFFKALYVSILRKR
jgi:lysyl-tRNA synthetase class 1